FGTSTSYGYQTLSMAVGAVLSPLAVQATLSTLQPNTVYHYRLVATNSSGTTRSADATFTTQPLPPPAVTTGSASGLTRPTATVAGTVNPGGAQASYRVEYGPDTGYGNATSWVLLGSANGALQVSAPLTGLAPGTTYHYRVVATSVNGTGPGP